MWGMLFHKYASSQKRQNNLLRHTLHVLKHDSKQQALFFFPAAGILPLATSKEIQEALWSGVLLQGWNKTSHQMYTSHLHDDLIANKSSLGILIYRAQSKKWWKRDLCRASHFPFSNLFWNPTACWGLPSFCPPCTSRSRRPYSCLTARLFGPLSH